MESGKKRAIWSFEEAVLSLAELADF